jgi:imidazolonepropionase-like amidohydrolase
VKPSDLNPLENRYQVADHLVTAARLSVPMCQGLAVQVGSGLNDQRFAGQKLPGSKRRAAGGLWRAAACVLLGLIAPQRAAADPFCAAPQTGPSANSELSAGAVGGPGLALFAAKLVTCAEQGPGYIDHGVLLVREGKIEALGSRGEIEVPAGYVAHDLGSHWLMPGMIDLHSHVGGTFDINDAVYQANPELRVLPAVIPDNEAFRVARAGGVTSVLFIPGSATTVGGQGVLLKTGGERIDEALMRSPGALKVAQADNPKAWGYNMQRGMLNWQIREVLRRGRAYGQRVLASQGKPPRHDLMFEAFPALLTGKAQVAAHTQQVQVVLATIQIIKVELGLPVFIDHGDFDSFEIAPVAMREGVQAIMGPRNFSSKLPSRGVDHDGRHEGTAVGFQHAGHPLVGFNTDAPVVPQEELFLQSTVAARFGFWDERQQLVRGLTSVPAITAGVYDRVGSLEVGKEADLVAISGHPTDPRSWVSRVWIAGRARYDAREQRRLF